MYPGVAGASAAVGAALALTLPLRADLSDLLPPHERSVRDLERIERRTTALGLVLGAVGERRRRAPERGRAPLAERIRPIDRALVADVVSDEGVGRRFAWNHRFLFAPLTDLESARDALRSARREAPRQPPLCLAGRPGRGGA